MGAIRQSKWRENFSHVSMRWRINDLRQLTLLVLLTFTVSFLLFQAQREIRGKAHDDALDVADHNHNQDGSSPEIDAASLKIPGQCTTWPVDTKGNYKPGSHNSSHTLQSFAPLGGWKKPEGIAIKALVFYGRKRTVDFLDCYLQQNLAVNGGYLDEVWFMVHTNIEDDLDYLGELVERRSQYQIVATGDCEGSNYACMWNKVVEDDTIYVKIDDDIVFIHPDAIPQLVSTRIAEPHPFAISANLVNSPFTGYRHYEVGAIHPFLPDPNSKPSRRAGQLWRSSDFASFPKNKVPTDKQTGASGEITEEILNKHVFADSSYEGHPWLLLNNVQKPLLKTPMGINHLRMGVNGGGAYGAAWKSWMIAAQQQYSLLRNIELDQMWRYHFGSQIAYPQGTNSSADEAALKFYDPDHQGPGAEQIFDTHYVRYNLNFVAMWGHDIQKALPVAEDDEQDFTVTKPQQFQRPFVIDTRSVVGHLSFNPQHEGIRQTDLLDRWRAFANEAVCTANNQKKPFDLRCPGF
ncbi:hypothetical protein F4808DRAFT_218989 [Astrocystis sublimbata]|nr:hypothetical protein F4808DRAFT_218989 [Astrocystis sublimbata]